jgi:methylthioribose-1-phosphate isomerase
MGISQFIQSVRWDGEKVVLLDQTKLPLETVFIDIDTIEGMWHAIKAMKVRGAPAIGIAAAYGLYLGIKDLEVESHKSFIKIFKEKYDYLASSRPTAVNLVWALNRMKNKVEESTEMPIADLKKILLEVATAIQYEDIEVCRKIGENLLTLLSDGMGILTHCNAGGIATAKYGTALAPIYLGKEKNMHFKVYADETRPLLQGARLTAWELQQAEIDVTLITDNMAAMVMRQGKVQAVIVGCDRVAANGDTANKIGTYGVAILAKEHGIPFYVAAPLSTIDLETKTGDDIIIEERDAEEVTMGFGKRIAPEGIKVFNPAFDVTPHEYITAIITEKGIIHPSFEEELIKVKS